MTATGRVPVGSAHPMNGWNRRILPVPGRTREGLLTEPTADALLGILDCAVHIAFNPVSMFKITQTGRTSSLSTSPAAIC